MEHLYALTFIPLLLITLAVHELGHLAAARLLKIKVAAFQIGMGTQLLSFSAGKTRIALGGQTAYHTGDQGNLTPGAFAQVHVAQEPDRSYRAVAVHQHVKGVSDHRAQTDPLTVFSPVTRVFHRRPSNPPPETLVEYNRTHMQLSGRVKEVTQSHIVLADVTWSLRLIPFMAAVFMPEDPSGRITNAHNNAPWRNKFLVTAAGPAANLLFLIVVLAALASVPFPPPSAPLITIDSVAAGSPAAEAGIKAGDYIIQIDNILVPKPDELMEKITNAMLTGEPITLHLRREKDTHAIKVRPDPNTGLLGITISKYIPPPREVSIQPGPVKDRFLNLTSVYFKATISLISAIGDEENEDPILSSPVMTAHYTAQAVEHAQLRAWLAILAVFTTGSAILNLLPIPPLDGYRLVIDTVQACRKNKPISPAIERAVTLSGISIIITATTYLIMADIVRLLD